MTFVRHNWHKLIVAVVVLVLLVFAYVYIIARPTSEHRDGDDSTLVPLRTLVLT